MPSGPSSTAAVRVSERIASCAAEYAAIPTGASSPAPDATFTTAPSPRSSMCGTHACMQRTVPKHAGLPRRVHDLLGEVEEGHVDARVVGGVHEDVDPAVRVERPRRRTRRRAPEASRRTRRRWPFRRWPRSRRRRLRTSTPCGSTPRRRAGPGERDGDAATDAGAGTGHDRDLALEQHLVLPRDRRRDRSRGTAELTAAGVESAQLRRVREVAPRCLETIGRWVSRTRCSRIRTSTSTSGATSRSVTATSTAASTAPTAASPCTSPRRAATRDGSSIRSRPCPAPSTRRPKGSTSDTSSSRSRAAPTSWSRTSVCCGGRCPVRTPPSPATAPARRWRRTRACWRRRCTASTGPTATCSAAAAAGTARWRASRTPAACGTARCRTSTGRR